MLTGKANTLEYIRTQLPSLPIPEFARLKASEFFLTSKAKKIAKTLHYPVILRSDGPEDGLGRSFAGLFQSRTVRKPHEMATTIDQVSKYHDRQEYAEILNDEPFNLDLKISKKKKNAITIKKTLNQYQVKRFELLKDQKNVTASIKLFIDVKSKYYKLSKTYRLDTIKVVIN